MIENATLVFGPPGCGKTHFLLDRVEEALENGVPPSQIVFVGFTRKAIREALSRACLKFNLSEKDFPYFKTLHALAFHILGLKNSDVIGSEDFAILGKDLGLDFRSQPLDLDEGGIPIFANESGSKYLFHIDRARYRGVTLEKEFNDAHDYDLNYWQMEKVAKVYEDYKRVTHKMDFVDMIEQFIAQPVVPYSTLLIVDEAQDLNHMQWLMVRKLFENSEGGYIAGDDDQAIYAFSGAEVSEFLNISDKKILLDQSYRLPKAILDFSKTITRQIRQREEKQFKPRDEEGLVQWHLSFDTLPIDNGEDWTIMTRVNTHMHEFARRLRDEGYVYSVKGNSSINQKKAQAILSWRKLQSGGKLWLREVKDMYEQMAKQGPRATVRRGSSTLLEAADYERPYSYEDLLEYGLLASKDQDAMDIAQLPPRERIYFESVERKNINLLDPPKIKLSTFHAMKGGQDDNVAVYLGTTRACHEGDPDDEHRAFYVAVTRAKNSLHIIESNKKYRYLL